MDTEADCIYDEAPACRGFRLVLSCLVVFILLTKNSAAGQLELFTITYMDGVFEVRIAALFDAPAEHVYSVIARGFNFEVQQLAI